MEAHDIPRLLVRKLDVAGKSPKEINDGVTEDLLATNPTDVAWTVTLAAEFWQTVDESTGLALRHGPPPHPVTLLPGQRTKVGDIRGWEWDSQLEMTLVCSDVAGREIRRTYWLNGSGARESRETVPGLGEVLVPESTGETTSDNPAPLPVEWLAQLRTWALEDGGPEDGCAGWACYRLGEAYETGKEIAAAPCTAALWYHHGAVLEDSDCQAALARLLEASSGVLQDVEAARYWHGRAAEGGDAGSALWLADRVADIAEALAWLRHGCRAGDRRCMIRAARLLIDGGGDRDEIALWIERAAELGEPEAQIWLAEMLAADDAWPRHRVQQDRDEAAHWLAVVGIRRLPPDLQAMAEGVAGRTGLPLPMPPREPSILAWRLRQTWGRMRNLLPMPAPRPEPQPPLLPVAELDFADLPRIGEGGMVTLMRHCNHGDFVLALLPGAIGEASRPVRHFVLNCMSSLAASMVMRDMLAADVSGCLEAPHRSQAVILDQLRDLVDNGEISLEAGLAAELRQRERRVATPRDVEDAAPLALDLYDSAHHAEYLTRHQALARRTDRGQPVPPPEAPPPGWYADHLEEQPNTVLRATLKAIGDGDLFCLLAGCSPFLRFRVWQISYWALRTRLVNGANGYPSQPTTPENYATARLVMDAALSQAHRDGRIGWWDA